MSETTRMNPHEHSVAYPVNHVISIMPTEGEAIAAFDTLTGGGFLESEVTLISGPELADRIGATSGRSGLVGRILQVVDRFGAGGDEVDARHEYEQALRDGRVNVLVLTPTEERKQRAAEILRQHGGHFINFFGRLEIEQLG
jgi:hypothetical protein